MAVTFTGTQFYSHSLPSNSTAFSVCGWFKLNTDRNDWTTLWDMYSTVFGYHVLQTDSSGTAVGLYSDGSNVLQVGSLTVGTWYFLGVSLGGNVIVRKRALGDPSFTSYSDSGHTPQANRLRIGDSHFNGERLAGAVAYFRLWTATLSAADLEAEYASPTPVRTANLYAYYRFDTASTTDDSGNGRTLTATGTPSSEASPVLSAAFSGWGIPIA